jgi:hypothetical protein
VAAAAAVSDAVALVSRMPEDKLAQHAEVRARVLADRGAVELWPGHLDEAVRFFDAGMAAATGPGGEHERGACLGHLALVEAMRGQLCHAVRLADQAAAALAADEQRPPQDPGPAALAALAWVHLERDELPTAGRLLKQLDAALKVSPDKLIGAVACLIAACSGLAQGHGEAAAQMVARARSGWSVPAWLDQRLSLVESRAYVAAGDISAAAAAAERAGGNSSPEAAATLAHAWLAAGDDKNARLVLASAPPARSGEPERVRVQARLADARLSYHGGDRARGRRSLAQALRLAEREQLRLPFVLEQDWIRPVRGIHLTGVESGAWSSRAPACTIRGRRASSRPGSAPTRTAWTTWSGCAGRAGSPARPAVMLEAGGWAMAGSSAPPATGARR